MVIGVNHRSAPVEVRERFWIPEDRRRDALEKLVCTDGIDEVLVLSTGECTEFILWTRDASAASGSVLNFLTREYGLQLCEWKHFYRKLDEAALAHVFLATAGLDSIASREKESTENFKDASVSALQAGTMGRFLDSVAQKTLTISGALRTEATREGLGAAEILSGREAKTFYAKLLQDYYGDAATIDDLYKYTWTRIPHFFNTPYYVYQYATCFASSAKLFKDMTTGEASARAAATARYLTLLKSGGNDHPMKQLQKAGVDLTQRQTVQAVVDQMNELVSQMEAEAAKITK